MRKLTLDVISFKQTETEPEYLYALNYDKDVRNRECYIDMDKYRNSDRIKLVTLINNEEGFGIVEATNNPAYDLPRIPEVFVKAYHKSPVDYPRIELWLPSVKEVAV